MQNKGYAVAIKYTVEDSFEHKAYTFWGAFSLRYEALTFKPIWDVAFCYNYYVFTVKEAAEQFVEAFKNGDINKYTIVNNNFISINSGVIYDINSIRIIEVDYTSSNDAFSGVGEKLAELPK